MIIEKPLVFQTVKTILKEDDHKMPTADEIEEQIGIMNPFAEIKGEIVKPREHSFNKIPIAAIEPPVIIIKKIIPDSLLTKFEHEIFNKIA